MKRHIKHLFCIAAVMAAIFIIQPVRPAADAATALSPALFSLKNDITTTWTTSGTAENPGGSNQYILFGTYPQTAIPNPGSDVVNAVYSPLDNTAIVYGIKYARVSGPSGYTYYRTDESIKWRVLSNDGNLVLMSERLLDGGKPYLYNGFTGTSGTLGKQVNSSWQNSDLRKWLNGEASKSAQAQTANASTLMADEYSYGYIDHLYGKYASSGFVNSAFSAPETAKIVPLNVGYTYYSQLENGQYLRSDSSVYDQKVYLLSGGFADSAQGVEIANNNYGFPSQTEVVGGLTVFKQSPSRNLLTTNYSQNIGAGTSGFQTRTSFNEVLGANSGGKSFIAGSTSVNMPVYGTGAGISPVIRLNLSSVLFASAAGGSLTDAGLSELRGPSTGNMGADMPGMMLRYSGGQGFTVANGQKVEYYNAPAGSRLVIAAQNGDMTYQSVQNVSGTGSFSLLSTGMQAGTYNYRAWLEQSGMGIEQGLLLACNPASGSFLIDYGVSWSNEPGKFTIVSSTGGALSSPQRTNAEGKFSFRVTLDPNYSQARNINVYANSLSLVPVNGVYTISDARADQSITVNIDVNLVSVDLQSGEGYRIKDAVSGQYLSNNPLVPFGSDLKFRVELLPGYNKSKDIAVSANSTLIAPYDGVYTISNIRFATSISITGISLNSYIVTLPEGVGFTISDISPATRIVPHGGTMSFRITLADGYQSNEYITVNATHGTLSGTFYTGFTLTDITGDSVITISGLNKSEYGITLPSGIGYKCTDINGSEIFGVQKVIYDDSFSFKIEFTGIYSQGKGAKVFITLGMIELQLTPVNGIYTVNNIRENKTIFVRELMLNSYTVSFSQGEGYSISFPDPADMKVAHGYNFMFRLDISKEYNKDTEYSVIANGVVIVTSGNGYYIVTGISKDTVISVEGLDKNKYNISLPHEDGFKFLEISNPSGAVESGGSYTFKISLSEEYSRSKDVIVRANSVLLVKDGNGMFSINSITADQIITVAGLVANIYTISLTPGVGYEYTEFTFVSVAHGGSFSFKLKMGENYTQQRNMQVMINGSAINSDGSGLFNIANIKDDIIILVNGLEINQYTLNFHTGTSQAIKPQTVNAGENITLLNDDILVKEGYVFIGWRDEAGEVHKGGAVLKIQSDINMYAVWEPEKMTFLKLITENIMLTVIAASAVVALVLLLIITSVVIKRRKNA